MRIDFRGDLVGDFVYHCHILEHEDNGMIAIIRVLPANSNSSSAAHKKKPAAVAFKEESQRRAAVFIVAMASAGSTGSDCKWREVKSENECGAEISGAASLSQRTIDRQTFDTFTTWISVKPSSPHGPFSTPIPDHLAPPNGRFGAIARC